MLRNLPEYIREAIARMAMKTMSEGYDSASIPSDVRQLLSDLFGDVDSANPYPRMASIMCISDTQAEIILSMLEHDELSALRGYLCGLAGSDMTRKQKALTILERIGAPETSENESEEPAAEVQEEEGGEFRKPDLAVIVDVSAVRSDAGEAFQIKLGEDGVAQEVRGCYDSWRQSGLCPAKGEVGFILKKKNLPEGVLCYLVVLNDLVVPVFEAGLRKVEVMEYAKRRTYNRIMAYDRCNARLSKLEIEII